MLRMSLPLPSSLAVAHARAKLRVLCHLRDELHICDPRALAQLDADPDDVRHVIQIQLTLLDTEIIDIERLITQLVEAAS